MANPLSSMETAAKQLAAPERDQFFKIKRQMEASGASMKDIEARLRAYLWEVFEADDEDEEDE